MKKEILKAFLRSITGNDIMKTNNGDYSCVDIFMDSNKYKELQQDMTSALDVVADLAKWSIDNPRGRVYGMNIKDKMDGDLIKLEDRAKELIDKYKSS